MDLKLTGKSVVITAASKGLGKAIATEFAREGAHVLISSRDEQTLQQTAAKIKDETNNDNVTFIRCDLTNKQDITELMSQATEQTGAIDILINNSGGPPAGDFLAMTDEDWYKAFELNLLSYVRTIRAAIPTMKKNNYGRIINIASSSIKQPIDQLVLSNTMRPGILGLSKSLSQEFGQHNILVNTVGPGTIATDRIKELNAIRAKHHKITPEQYRKEAEQQIPLKRYGEPAEFAKAVVFLASSANTYITGQSLLIDGGSIKAL